MAGIASGELQGQVAVVTGGGRGLGLAFVRALAQQGALPVIAELNEELGHRARKTLAEEGLFAEYMHLDVADAGMVEEVAQRTKAQYGRLDLWINNAGLARHQPSEQIRVETWQLCLGVMLSGTFFGCQSAGRIMITQGRGNIINIASVNGLVAQPGRAAYNSAKAAIIHLTATLAAEWASSGVRVNAVAPNVFMTELARDSINFAGAASMETYINRVPAHRFGELPELVHAILFLASDRSSYITGQTLRVDGALVSDHYL